MLVATICTGLSLVLTIVLYRRQPPSITNGRARRALPPWAARLPLHLGDALDSVCIAVTGFSLLFMRSTVPEAASQAAKAARLQAAPRGRDKCIPGVLEASMIDGQPTLIVANRKLANQILESKNFYQRPAADEGLKELGMYHRGIIWNNDLDAWHRGRLAFKRALNAQGLEEAKVTLDACVEEAVQSLQEESFVDMKQFFQMLTLDFTLRWAFDCPPLSLQEKQELGRDVSAYFVAWEYFLLRRSWWEWWPWSEARRHKESQRRLFDKMEQLLASLPVESNAPFMNHVRECTALSSEQTQLALEMLIAGTDTSSISLYYCLLLLADRKEDMAALRLALKSPDPNAAESMLSSCLLEAIRMKTVGPVIMRKCTETTSFTLEVDQQPLDIAKGTNIIIDNATMHQDDDHFAPTASEFQMRRWMHIQPRAQQEIFRPFGSNDKGCVGQYLAMLEMRKVLSALLTDFDFERHPSTASFQHLQTQWQVANVPLGSHLLRPMRPPVTGVFLIGPPSSGKTTLLKRLKDKLQGRPICYVEEVARRVMEETGTDRSVFNDATPARVLKVQALQDQIFARQKPLEMEAFQTVQDGRVQLVLADRSLLCPVVFGEVEECERSFLDELRDQLDRHYRGRPVHFILLPPEPKFQKDDGTRHNNFQKAEPMFQHYIAILNQFHLPYTILHNCLDLESRVDAVLALPLPTIITE